MCTSGGNVYFKESFRPYFVIVMMERWEVILVQIEWLLSYYNLIFPRLLCLVMLEPMKYIVINVKCIAIFPIAMNYL